ncbi:MAG: hypothetical protein HYZ87_05115 [Candidatus Omnitrophica bacterium]|nr:hypothetical protein [Candidatus Omnitrophota bacterium]
MLTSPVLAQSMENPRPAKEQVLSYQFADGVKIKVHADEQTLRKSGADSYFPREVLDAAVLAYQTIKDFLGFSSDGYSFANPDRAYAYDPDRTIDIFLGRPANENVCLFHGIKRFSFGDAPCFDTLKLSESEYEAVILLPTNYRQFIKGWERLNPSPLGTRNVEVDLRGTLIHEMLHVVLFYYNKNMNKESRLETSELGDMATKTAPSGGPQKTDWYVEGLARYFETFAGAKHDFYSQGFKQTLPDKIRFSRGGSNYFMRYPDQSFMDLRYENAIFWRFIDNRYGMKSIERLSRELRNSGEPALEKRLERVLGSPFSEILKSFSKAALSKDFGLKEEQVYLKDIARTHLALREDGFYLVDGFGEERLLGEVCATDWVGRWEKDAARHGQTPVAGDSTEEADVSGWASDFIQIDRKAVSLPWLGVKNVNGSAPLTVQAFLVTRGGFRIEKEMKEILPGRTEGLRLSEIVAAAGLSAEDIEKIYLIVTNLGPRETTRYEIIEKSSISLTS